VQIQGVVIDDPDVRDDRIQFRLRAESIFVGSQTHKTDGLVLVRASRVADVAYGDYIAVSGKLFTPAEFDTFSYSDFLARQGVYSIMENTIIEPISKQDGFSFYATVFRPLTSS
jgi:competence protein ComEC